MQFAYQFPERTERLVLVSAGGVGREVNPVLRLVTLPGAHLALSALRLPGMRLQVGLTVGLMRLLDTDLGRDAPELLTLVDALPDETARNAFIRTLRAVVDWRGQVVTMLDRCYLTEGMPTMLLWGDRDSVVPVRHAYGAHEAMPGSRLEIFEGAGHFPFHTDPARFLSLVGSSPPPRPRRTGAASTGATSCARAARVSRPRGSEGTKPAGGERTQRHLTAGRCM